VVSFAPQTLYYRGETVKCPIIPKKKVTVVSLYKLTGNTWKVLNYGAGERY